MIVSKIKQNLNTKITLIKVQEQDRRTFETKTRTFESETESSDSKLTKQRMNGKELK